MSGIPAKWSHFGKPASVLLQSNVILVASYQSDPRFRKYVQLIEKNLNSFDAVNEWADIISFLGRLLKSFQAYPQFPVIPRKHTVAKRLAQCLNPGFPAGVHQKTLDVYAYILETIGTDQLADDLALWSLGLFPFVQYAAMHVKPQLLDIFEKYYFPLKSRLRSAMRGFIIALLPALDEEGSEFFDKVVTLMDHLSNMVDLPFFYSCTWHVMISNPGLRPPALNYLLRRLPKITNAEEVAVVLGGGECISYMVRAFAATLGDSQLLVQRGMLELLVQNFALKHRTIPHDDLVVLMKSALSIVLRKDMSLNRRLYAWLLGDDGNSQIQMKYFKSFGEKAAIQAVRALFYATTNHTPSSPQNETYVSEAQRPYKILISLLDKWEIGQPIVQGIFTDSLVSLQTQVRKVESSAEIVQTANMWMEMMEPYLIWMNLFALFDANFPDKAGAFKLSNLKTHLNNLNLIEFTLKSYKFTDEEIRQMHLPLVLAAMTQKLQDSIKHPSFIDMLPLVDKCVQLIHTILQMIPENIFWDRRTSKVPDGSEKLTTNQSKEFYNGMDVLEYSHEFYGIRPNTISDATTTASTKQSGNNKDVHDTSSRPTDLIVKEAEDEGDLSMTHTSGTGAGGYDGSFITHILATRPHYGPIRGSTLVTEVIQQLSQFLAGLVANYIIPPEKSSLGVDVGVDGKRLRSIDSQLEKVLHSVCSALTLVAKHADERFEWDQEEQAQLTHTLLLCCENGREFGTVDAGLSTMTQLMRRHAFIKEGALRKRTIAKHIMDNLWGFLSPAAPLLHMRTVQLIWLLTDASAPHQIETVISSYLITRDDNERLLNYEKFGILWEFSEDIVETATTFARPMFLILDLLQEGASPVDRRVGETWLRCHLRSYVRLLEPFVLTMLSKDIIRRPTEKKISHEHQVLYDNMDHVAVVPYYLYLRPFDMSTIDYMFRHLLSLINFGSLGFLKTCKNHRVALGAGAMPDLIESSLGINFQEGNGLSFLELLVQISLRYLATEPCDKYRTNMLKSVRSIQLHAAELLYQTISKLDYVDMKLTRLIQESVLRKLLFCISTSDLELQQKLLHLLHATMAITAAAAFNKPGAITTHSSSSPSERSSSYRRKVSVDSTQNEAAMLAQYASDAVPRAAAAAAAATTTAQQNTALVAPQAVEAIDLANTTSALFVKCVTDAFMLPSNRPILQHWMDFVLASLPHMRGGFRQMVIPILMCVCEQITLCHTAVRLLMHGDVSNEYTNNNNNKKQHKQHGPYLQEASAVSVGGPEQDILVFLNGIEKILLYCLTDRSLNDDWHPTTHGNDTWLPIPRVAADNASTLKGFAQLVHADEPVLRANVRARDVMLFHLPVVLHILLDVWRVFRQPHWDKETSDALGYAKMDAVLQSFAYAADHVKARLETIFERLYKYCAVDFIEGFTEIFFMENPVALEYEASRDQFDLVAIEVLSATPTSSPHHILSTLLDGIRQRTPGMQIHRRRHIQRTGKLTDTSMLRFAEIYCSNLLKTDTLAHLWPLMHSFAKDYLSQAQAYKTIFPGLLRFLTVAVDGLTRSTSTGAGGAASLEERKKARRDAQDLYQRCVDYCILIAGRSFDQGLWLRRSNVYDESSSNNSSHHLHPMADDTTPGTPTDTMSLSDTMSESARNMSSSNVSDLEKKASWKSREDVMIAQVNGFLASTVIPNLPQLIGDQDRINSLLNNLVYYVIGPALRTRAVFSKIAIILDQICEMTQLAFSYKTWRKEVWEVFLDNRFFYMSATTAKKWRKIVQTVFSLEKERFTELMSRVTTSPSTAFFTNKDQETLNRALNLRRLSYVIFCGTTDQYVPQLPIIQEKLVELLKLDHGEMVHVEIYLCLRIMLVRFSQKHLLNFWPVLITELMRLFNAFLYNNVNDRPEEAQIALAGCKFLDLLCALELDAFQIFEWIFIRDTVATTIQISNEDQGPIPIMNRLGEKLTETSDSVTHSTRAVFDAFPSDVADPPTPIPSLGQLKRPMLTMRSISSIQQLAFFVEHVSLYAYQCSFTLAHPDMPFIESLLQTDLLEGDIESEFS
ncbi:Dopey, N-terminal-domain-containing protein [Phascolomyces articulosus]|uniref:Dopey, N-terminal-domain-containing protein n=1 Tax=Phascolomyces articulosus TaxID=60185 RepID=A0AAD5JXF6_9FUNG|nr:Dopey, N-terminal-domain-containing protein [Phascolomyces articulosus]